MSRARGDGNLLSKTRGALEPCLAAEAPDRTPHASGPWGIGAPPGLYAWRPNSGARLGEQSAPARRERKGGVPENLRLRCSSLAHAFSGYLARTSAGATLPALRAPVLVEALNRSDWVCKSKRLLLPRRGAGRRPALRSYHASPFIEARAKGRGRRSETEPTSARRSTQRGRARSSRPAISESPFSKRLPRGCMEGLVPSWASGRHLREVCELDPRCRGEHVLFDFPRE
jgi:hypothetical protein